MSLSGHRGGIDTGAPKPQSGRHLIGTFLPLPRGNAKSRFFEGWVYEVGEQPNSGDTGCPASGTRSPVLWLRGRASEIGPTGGTRIVLARVVDIRAPRRILALSSRSKRKGEEHEN
jgi:hypothetical protein